MHVILFQAAYPTVVGDKMVVPYNAKMMLDWEGHCNLEYAASSKCLLYLYKYLYKGPGKVKVDIYSKSPESDIYLRGRFICSLDAIWRILGYQTYPSSKPKVRVIKVKDEPAVKALLEKGNSCDMLIYFNRPMHCWEMTYTELFKMYVVDKTLPARYKNKPHLHNIEYFTIEVTGLRKPVYLCLRAPDRYPAITRMEMLYLTAGDLWYLRLILKYTKPLCYADCHSHFGDVYSTYQAAALAKGLVTDHLEALKNFEELIEYCGGNELRGLFCLYLIHGFPMLPVYNNEIIRTAMMEDYLKRNDDNIEQSTNDMLKDLKRRLDLASAQNLTFYGLDEPMDETTELDKEKLLHSHRKNYLLLNELNIAEPNNPDQQAIFDHLSGCFDNISNTQCELHFIAGPAGVGKTSLVRKLQADARSKGHIIKTCASTTLAAALYKDGVTAHSLFKYPVAEDDEGGDIEEPLECKLWHTQRLDLLQQCKVIFWDEFVSNHRMLFEAVMKIYKENNINCLFICCGDFRQILPVVKRGNAKDVIESIISSSNYWRSFTYIS